MKLVLDTNVLVSALIQPGSPPAMLLDAWLDESFELVTSTAQLTEFAAVLARPQIQKRIRSEEAVRVVALLRAEAIVVDALPDLKLSPDPDDNPILAAAVAGRAELVVSGDRRGMLDLGHVEGIPIVTPRAALERFTDC